MLVKEIKANDYLTKSNLPASDYVINPYIKAENNLFHFL